MEELFVFSLLFFLFGTVIGSFLNVLVDRIPRNESVIKSRSHCEHCRHKLAWYDLIPVFSYIFLGGKCRYCQKHIGYYYPFVEVLTGVLFVMTLLFAVPDISLLLALDSRTVLDLLYYLFLISCLIVVVFTDMKYGIIPFKIAGAALIVAFLYALFSPYLLSHILSAIATFGLFLFLFLITRGKGLGFGDVVYAFLMGLVLGYPKIIVGLYIAFLTGAIISLILVWTGKKKLKGGSIPFGPFLVGGTILGLFYGDFFVNKAMQYLVR